MINKKDIEVKEADFIKGVGLKICHKDKIFEMCYSHIDINNATEVNLAVEYFINHILGYWKILNLTLENKKVAIPENEVIQNYFISGIFAQGGENDNEKELLDIYYLARKELDANYIITDEVISIATDSTGFANITPYKEVDIKELLDKRLAIIRGARENKIPISYKNKTKDIINNNKDRYNEDIKLSKKLYKEFKSRWEYIRDFRGLHAGLRDDKYLETTTEIRWEFEALRHRDKPIGIINSVANKINELYEGLIVQDNKNYAKIYL